MASDATPEAIAQWILDELERKKDLYQAEAAREIARRFGPEFTYTNENGNPAIDKRVLNALRELTGDTVIWNRFAFSWHKMKPAGAPGRKQT